MRIHWKWPFPFISLLTRRMVSFKTWIHANFMDFIFTLMFKHCLCLNHPKREKKSPHAQNVHSDNFFMSEYDLATRNKRTIVLNSKVYAKKRWTIIKIILIYKEWFHAPINQKLKLFVGEPWSIHAQYSVFSIQ